MRPRRLRQGPAIARGIILFPGEHLAHRHEDGNGARLEDFADAATGTALGSDTAYLVQEGFEDGQAGVDDAELSFEGGEHSDDGVSVLRISVSDCGGEVDAVDGDSADTVAVPRLAFRQEDSVGLLTEGTYAMPKPNMPLNLTLFPIFIFKPQRTGIGSTTAMISRSRLTIPM